MSCLSSTAPIPKSYSTQLFMDEMLVEKNARGRNKTIETPLVSLRLHCMGRYIRLLSYPSLSISHFLHAFLFSYNILSQRHGITSPIL